MTHDDLIDFYAGLAMLGLCSGGKWPESSDQKHIAKFAYGMADEMMEERKRRDFEERTSC